MPYIHYSFPKRNTQPLDASFTAQKEGTNLTHGGPAADDDRALLDTSYDNYPQLSEVLVSQLLSDVGKVTKEEMTNKGSAPAGNNFAKSQLLDQIQREVEELENIVPITLPSSSDLIDFQQAKTPKLLSKLDAIADVPVDLLPKKDDLSNRIDIINRKLDDQVQEMKNFEQKTADLQNVLDECRGKMKTRDLPAPIDDVTKDEQDLSAVLLAIDSIPQEDLSPRNQLARDVNNIKEQVKGQLASLRKALPDEMKARQQQDEVKDRLYEISQML
ncbi:hypothetical protein COOONC_15721 [Cooperia oncophora]